MVTVGAPSPVTQSAATPQQNTLPIDEQAVEQAAVATAAADEGQTGITTSDDIVLGIPVEDIGSRRIIRCVIILATTVASFHICLFNAHLMRGVHDNSSSNDATNTPWTSLSSLLIELSIPACGYCGAMYHNRQLTCCFCSCNIFVVVLTATHFARTQIRISEIDGNCERESDPNQRRQCEVWTSSSSEKWLLLISTVVVFCLGCLAFWFGNILYNKLSQASIPPVPPLAAIVGEVVSLNTDVANSTAGDDSETRGRAARTQGLSTSGTDSGSTGRRQGGSFEVNARELFGR